MEVTLKVGDKVMFTKDTPNKAYWGCIAEITDISEYLTSYKMTTYVKNTQDVGTVRGMFFRKLTKLELALK